MKANIFITVDTECSIGGAFNDSRLKPIGSEKRIFGENGGTYYGIPLIMDIADRYGIQLTFFLEVMNKYYFGENENRRVCEYIIQKGHDVQLHAHPNFLNFTEQEPQKRAYSDWIGEYPVERQEEILTNAKKTLFSYGVSNVSAFRAGSFGAAGSTILALKRAGFLIDSSYNRAFIGRSCLFSDLKINDLSCLDGIWEFPITNFIESTMVRRRRYVPMDINGAGFGEMRHVLNSARTQGPRNVTIILHSFSFIKKLDFRYIKVKPRHQVIARFENLCRFLAEHDEHFWVRTLGSLDASEVAAMAKEARHVFPGVSIGSSLFRACEQLKDHLL